MGNVSIRQGKRNFNQMNSSDKGYCRDDRLPSRRHGWVVSNLRYAAGYETMHRIVSTGNCRIFLVLRVYMSPLVESKGNCAIASAIVVAPSPNSAFSSSHFFPMAV